MAEVKLNWNSTEQSPQNQIGAPDQLNSELKVRQKERVSSRFDTRLWLYRLHGRVQSEAFRFNLRSFELLI